MPTKEQLTKELERLTEKNLTLARELDQTTLTDGEAKALDKVIQALTELERAAQTKWKCIGLLRGG